MLCGESIGLYIHIPYCVRKCAYCDFYSVALEGDAEGGRSCKGCETLSRAARALAKEIELLAARFGRQTVRTIYFGGGTPSLMPPDAIALVLDAARSSFDVQQGAEITMEANPGTVTLERLCGYSSAGVNRLSIGAQSTSDRLLKAIGRIHTADEIFVAADFARAACFSNISFDVMYGLPGQTLDDLSDTLDSLLRFNPEHMSCYELTLEPDTPMGRMQPELPDEDAVIKMNAFITQRLRDTGLFRYEISNYARAGYACRHNLIYWNRETYLGIGPAAHSFLNGARFANEHDVSRWLSRIERVSLEWDSHEGIPPDEARFESMMLGLRLTDGVDLQAFWDAHGSNPLDVWPNELNDMRKLGWLNWNARRVWLTPRGLMMHNAVCGRLL